MNADLKKLKKNPTLSLILGIGLIILGTASIYSSVTATFVSVLFFGWLLIFAGCLQLAQLLVSGKEDGVMLHLVAGFFSLLTGGLLVYNPVAGATSLTLLLSLLFISQGILRVFIALTQRFAHWSWVLINGIITLILGILILMQWPYSGLYVIGMFIGIDLMLSGWALVMVYLKNKR